MGFLDDLKFKVGDKIKFVTSLCEKWSPRKCKTEKDYEVSLYNYLHKELANTKIQITKQFAQGRIKADLLIGDKVIIELKTNLNSTAVYQRLTGQLLQYGEWKGRVIILLTGETEPNLRKELQEFVKKQNSAHEDFFDFIGQGEGSKFTIFEK